MSKLKLDTLRLLTGKHFWRAFERSLKHAWRAFTLFLYFRWPYWSSSGLLLWSWSHSMRRDWLWFSYAFQLDPEGADWYGHSRGTLGFGLTKSSHDGCFMSAKTWFSIQICICFTLRWLLTLCILKPFSIFTNFSILLGTILACFCC